MRLLMDDNYYKLYCSIHASMWEGILRTNIWTSLLKRVVSRQSPRLP